MNHDECIDIVRQSFANRGHVVNVSEDGPENGTVVPVPVPNPLFLGPEPIELEAKCVVCHAHGRHVWIWPTAEWVQAQIRRRAES